MPAPYSLDLRIRCIEAIKRGETANAVAKWAGQGGIEPITDYRRGPPAKVDLEKLRVRIEGMPDKRLKEIGDELGVSQTTVSRHLKAMGYTRKKRRFYTASEKKNNGLNLKRS